MSNTWDLILRERVSQADKNIYADNTNRCAAPWRERWLTISVCRVDVTNCFCWCWMNPSLQRVQGSSPCAPTI